MDSRCLGPYRRPNRKRRIPSQLLIASPSNFKILKIGPIGRVYKSTFGDAIRDSKFEIGLSLPSIRTMSADARAQELERRLILFFAAQIVDVASKLPRTTQGRHISSQVMRSATA